MWLSFITVPPTSFFYNLRDTVQRPTAVYFAVSVK
jgi:hypothetical protein